MANYVIYCDTSCCTVNNLCAWGCVICYPSGKNISYSGCYTNCCNSAIGEMRAIIKAIGKVKCYSKVRLLIFSDSNPLVEQIASMKKLKHAKALGSEWVTLFQYKQKMNIMVEYVRRKQNPAHSIAKKELIRCRKAIQLKALNAASSEDQENLDIASSEEQEDLNAAFSEEQENLDIASSEEQEDLNAAFSEDQENLDTASSENNRRW